MLSLSLSTVKSLCFSTATHRSSSVKPNRRVSVLASLNPSPFIPAKPQPQQQQLYQPFRPPPSPIPSKYADLDTAGRIEVLANRLGAWYEYAPLISALLQEGFSPPTIEELTGISGVEQNRFIVAGQVRESLQQSDADPDVIASFDTGGAELLYEIRLLSATQRAAAARFIVENKMDGKGANELARAIKDYPRRKGEKGWESFDYALPGDCLSFLYYRLSREHRNPSEERTSSLEQALAFAETEKAKRAVLEELEGGEVEKEGEEDEVVKGVRVPVVRLKMGEVAEAGKVVVLPVCKAENGEKEVLEAPSECRSVGVFGVVTSQKGWGRWVVLPGWEPVVTLGEGGVVVSFVDARVLPWKVNRDYKEEPILVVADRGNREVLADDGFYLASVGKGGDGGGLKVARGSVLKESGIKESLGTVVLVVRPPKEDTDDQLSDEDWE